MCVINMLTVLTVFAIHLLSHFAALIPSSVVYMYMYALGYL